MQVLERGHVYVPETRTPDGKSIRALGPNVQKITFVNKQPGQEHDGTTTQEILRVLIDRTRHCANCMPHPVNEQVVYHLRRALVLHEMRALERKFEKGEYIPEYVPVGGDGHFSMVTQDIGGENHTPELLPYKQDWEREPNHPIVEA